MKMCGISLRRQLALGLLLFGFTLSSLGRAQGAVWSLSEKLSPLDGSAPAQSTLFFNKDTTSLEYTPAGPPLGLISSEAVQLKGTQYFVTGWAHGAHTLVFRVFAPEKNKARPLCEVASLGESTRLRLNKGILEIEVIQDDAGSVTWARCE